MAKTVKRPNDDGKVKVAMLTGRFVIDSSRHEWISPTRRERIDGVSIEMDGRWSGGGKGYATLDTSLESDRLKLKRLQELIDSGRDAERIKKDGIRILPPDHVEPPFPWWSRNVSAKKLLGDVESGLSAMSSEEERERFVLQCIKYEMSLEDPRESLIKALEKIDISEVQPPSPLDPKE